RAYGSDAAGDEVGVFDADRAGLRELQADLEADVLSARRGERDRAAVPETGRRGSVGIGFALVEDPVFRAVGQRDGRHGRRGVAAAEELDRAVDELFRRRRDVTPGARGRRRALLPAKDAD